MAGSEQERLMLKNLKKTPGSIVSGMLAQYLGFYYLQAFQIQSVSMLNSQLQNAIIMFSLGEFFIALGLDGKYTIPYFSLFSVIPLLFFNEKWWMCISFLVQCRIIHAIWQWIGKRK